MTTTRDVVRLPIVRYCSIVLMAFLSMSGASAQNDHAVQSPSLSPPPYQKQSLTLSFGAGIPQSRTGLTSFWEMGPSVSVKFMIHVNRALAFGIGLDVAHLWFKEHSFQSRFPGIAVRPQDITMGALSLAMKYSLLPTMRFSPFVGATVGATRLSEAVYRETVDSVRVTYYNIPGRTRLTFGLTAGLDIYVVRWLSLQLEAKTTYIHNDPDLGFASFLRGGIRLTL
jgi:opacity protein-like surface antigen